MYDDRKRRRLDAIVWSAATLFLMFAWPAVAAPPAGKPGEAAWREECGGCHVPYPAWALPPAAWQRMLDGLDRHFGVDASLEPAVAAEVGRYLSASQKRRNEAFPASLRITDTDWFRREHREVPARRWREPQVKSAANCQACHAGAAQGRYEEEEGHERD